MRTRLIPLAALLLAVVSCGRDSAVKKSEQQQYDTVQEGAASGVASTIGGPGEAPPPMTGTNADTTTAFALNGSPATTTDAGALASPPMYSGAPPTHGTAATAPVSQIPSYHPPASALHPAQSTEPAPSQPAPEQTDTAAQPDNQDQSTETAPDQQQGEHDAEPAPANDETATAPPPPPPTT
jgi:hypothetical protein